MKSIVFIITLLLATASVSACSCLQAQPPLEALSSTDVVFIGTVTHVQGSESSAQYTFTVRKIFKGTESATQIVTAGTSSAACGVVFEEGQEYLVYAYKSEDGLTTNLCSRTALLSEAHEDLNAFNYTDYVIQPIPEPEPIDPVYPEPSFIAKIWRSFLSWFD